MTTRVLLAGTAGEAAGRHHQRDMFGPGVAASDLLEVSGVWPGPPGGDGYARAAELATALDRPLMADLSAALADADAVVACLDAAGLDQLLDHLPEPAAVPVLVDKAVLLGTERLTALSSDPRAGGVRAAYHSRFHPGVVSLAGIVRSGELGLPHALHGELLVPFGDGPTAEGDLWHVGVLALDAVAAVLGPPAGDVHAVRTPSGDPATETWTLTVRWHPGVVVTLLVSRGQPGVAAMLHRYRLMGSEGQVLVDLAAPSFTVVGDGTPVLYGPGLVQLELETLAQGGAGTTVSDLMSLSRLIVAAERSAVDGRVHAPG
jgi:predicted dehydrogenase